MIRVVEDLKYPTKIRKIKDDGKLGEYLIVRKWKVMPLMLKARQSRGFIRLSFLGSFRSVLCNTGNVFSLAVYPTQYAVYHADSRNQVSVVGGP